MPKNYQISQYASPVGINGRIELLLGGRKKEIGIHDVHLEEDAGKMIHRGGESLLDYNRAGTPLLEIVTQPDIESGEEAELFIQQFRQMVRYLRVCDGNMEEGSLRCDANVSINREGRGLGIKTEVKNLNSSRNVKHALEYEIDRQKEILDSGEKVIQETRLWDAEGGFSQGMRSKESAHDYRYFPEPDLPPFRPDSDFFSRLDEALVELPEQRKARMMEEYRLTEEQADFICEDIATADFLENTLSFGSASGQQTAAWLSSDVQRILNRDGIRLEESPCTPQRLSSLINLINEGTISGKIGKQVLEFVFSEDKDPSAIVEERGLKQIADTGAVEALVDQAIRENQKAVEQIRSGDTKPLGFLVGQVMKFSSGKADPKLVQKLLREKLLS
jgi:aspartyl-tRNA(Asn)/glutamyl-tRNA(Gln) amidotransferase subunit B